MMADHRARGRGTPGNTVHELMGSGSDHVRSWTGWKHTPMILLRYEDILADPLGQLGMVARKLGIARDEARIRRAVEFSPFEALQAQQAQSGFRPEDHTSELQSLMRSSSAVH